MRFPRTVSQHVWYGGAVALVAVCVAAASTLAADPGSEPKRGLADRLLNLPMWKQPSAPEAPVEPSIEIDGQLQSGIQADPLARPTSVSNRAAVPVPRPPVLGSNRAVYQRAVKVPLDHVVPAEVMGPPPVTPPGAERHMLFENNDIESVPAPPIPVDPPLSVPGPDDAAERQPGSRFMLFGGSGPKPSAQRGQRYMLFDQPAPRSTTPPMTADSPFTYRTPFKLFQNTPEPTPAGMMGPGEMRYIEGVETFDGYPAEELPPPSSSLDSGTQSVLAPAPTSPRVGSQVDPGISSGVLSAEILSPEIVGEGVIVDNYLPMESGHCDSCGCQHGAHGECWNCHPFWGKFAQAFGQHDPHSEGVGYERVALAPFFVEASQPFTHFGLRVDNAYNWERPDRAEYLWSKIGGRGPPKIDSGTDYQQVRFTLEAGTQSFSTITSLPLTILDPDQNNNTAGLGDMSVATKTVFINGDYWQFSQITRTYFNTGLDRRGLGSGHVSMEPGLLVRYRVSDRTYWHNELKFWFPLGGDPVHSGEVFVWGTGVTTIMYETDMIALIPSFELHGWSVLDGQQTEPNGVVLDIDPEGILNIAPGMRFVYDNGGDLGLLEIGLASDVGITSNRFYSNLFRIDFRWSY